jgi:hypothetical protein
LLFPPRLPPCVVADDLFMFLLLFTVTVVVAAATV